jgi:phosphoribosylformylglycinamidine synthase subunit PurQ / glutaminase
MKRVSVVVFPGSNCDHDVIHLYRSLLGTDVAQVWHKDRDLKKPDVVIVPGGFSYGDYLRTGALAKLSPVMEEVSAFAKKGGPVLGICNGFQILCEAGLLPGVLLQNIGMKFLSRFVNLKVENTTTPFTRALSKGSVITCPIAHGEGNYFADPETIKKLEAEGQVIFCYSDPAGNVQPGDRESNPNGSVNAIAGISSAQGNVVGMMPHPERAAESIIGWIGQETGRAIFESAIS